MTTPDGHQRGGIRLERLQRRIDAGSEQAARRLMQDVRGTFQAFDRLWLEAEIEVRGWTKTGTLRHPVFKALRVEGG
jgi:ATP-dependent DNA ligase